MLQTLRSKILAISTATVVGALAITGAATYHIVRGSTFQTIEQDLCNFFKLDQKVNLTT